MRMPEVGLVPEGTALQAHFTGVEDVERVERLFDFAVDAEGDRSDGFGEPRRFGEADAVFSCDGASVGEDPL